MTQKHFYFLACLLSLGCASKDDSTGDSAAETDKDTDTDTDTDTGTDTGPTTTTFSPTEGTWLAKDFVIDSDDCALGFLYGLTADSRVWWELDSGDDDWSITASNGLVASCTQSSNDVECLATSVFDYTEGGFVGAIPIPPTDAVVTLIAANAGTLTSDITSTVATTYSGDCVGVDCDTLLGSIGVTSPCTTEVSSFDFSQEAFAPTDGTWAQAGFEWADDGCNAVTNLGSSGGPADDIAILNGEDGTFTATIASSGDVYNCSTDGLNFTCEPIVFMSLEDITVSIGGTGRFGNEESYAAQFNMVADCSGDDCEDMSAEWGVDFPCTSTGTTSAALSE
jgi:hypothetical protein